MGVLAGMALVCQGDKAFESSVGESCRDWIGGPPPTPGQVEQRLLAGVQVEVAERIDTAIQFNQIDADMPGKVLEDWAKSVLYQLLKG
jgi:hypothetical protein